MYNATEMTKVKDKEKADDTINKIHNLNKDEKILLFA